MAAPTFLQILTSEVARMQTLHPEREGELARAHALILHGQVLPSADDPATGRVLSSDGEKRYTVNGQCDCQAGQHGKPCKHLQSWRLYQYITKRMEAQPTPDDGHVDTKNLPLPEASASVNVRVTTCGREVQWTLRDHNEARLATRLEALLARYPMPQPASQASSQGEGWCSKHGLQMKSSFRKIRGGMSYQ
jgi:hypothetical protein